MNHDDHRSVRGAREAFKRLRRSTTFDNSMRFPIDTSPARIIPDSACRPDPIASETLSAGRKTTAPAYRR